MPKSYKPPIAANRIAILGEGYLDLHYAKTATGVIRYRSENVVCVVDSHYAGTDTSQVLKLPQKIPIVGTLKEAFTLKPDCVLIGIATTGGVLPDSWRPLILESIKNKLHVINGLHYFLNEDKEFVAAAKKNKVILWDVRQPSKERSVASMKVKKIKSHTILAVGTDCAVGKMSAMLECHFEAQKRKLKSAFLATGQTGIMISGRGIPLDRIIGDFMAGAVEQMILEESKDADFLWVEGQGSVLHPGYSGVTLALIHGACAEMMILCHQANHTHIDDNPDLPIPSFPKLIQLHETLIRPLRPSKVIGISVNTSSLSESAAKKYLADIEKQTGLPATDPVRFTASKLLDAVLKHIQ